MLALLLVQIGSSMPIYGNFSQNYYYVELNNKRWILDQGFNGAIELLEMCSYIKSQPQYFYAQRFISIQAIPLEKKMIRKDDDAFYICQDTCHMQLGDLVIQNYCGQYYTYKQEINNYLGLGEIVQNLNSSQQLKLCLAQNGGYMKIGTFQKDEQNIQIDFIKPNCVLKSNCQQNRLKLISIEVKQLQLFPFYNDIDAEVDFTNTYVVFPPNIYLSLIKQFICQGVFCPQRNDIDGLTCYENDYDNLDKFYEKFPKIHFKFKGTSEFIWFPQDYLVTNDNKTYCFPIKRGIKNIILGQPFMRNKEFIFGTQKLIVNYQNCSSETNLDAPTISLQIKNVIAYLFTHHLLHSIQDQIKENKLIIDQSTYSMIILLFSIASSQLIFDLKGDEYKTEYYIELQIGTPQKSFNFVVDTGAPSTSLICNTESTTLNQCNQVQDQYCLTQLSTYDGELSSAIHASDIINIGKNKITFDFQCIQDSGTQILGMGSQSNFINVLYNEFKFESKHQIFSILLTNEKGKLTIGQDYPKYDEINIPFDKLSPYFSVDLATVTDDKNNLVFQPNQSENYEIIVDTGSTLINMDSETLQSFIKSFDKCQQDPRGCPKELDIQGQQCYFYDRFHYGDISNFYETFPQFSFNFKNGYKYLLNAKDYLLNQFENYYCLPFNDYTRNYEPKFKKIILLGQPFMRNKEFYFDMTDSKIFIKHPDAQQNVLQFSNLSDIISKYYLFVELGLLIGIWLFYRKYSVQIRGMFRSGRANQGLNPYA